MQSSPVPLRGTQSLVGVAARIWKRPGLTARELLWRWPAAVPLLLLLGWAGARAMRGVQVDWAALGAMTVFKPVEAAATLGRALDTVLPPALRVLRWWLPLAIIVWTAASAWGRTAIWRRLDPALRPRFPLVFALGLVRSLLLLAVFALWIAGWRLAGSVAITGAVAAGREPNLVLYTAIGVGVTLALFLSWSATSWVLDAAPLFAMGRHAPGFGRSLHAAATARALGAKLVELNLVMGIVRVAVLVLATVFSACPLPFTSVETPLFLAVWWSLVAVLWTVVSDIFQVVRRAAYLNLFRELTEPAEAASPALPAMPLD